MPATIQTACAFVTLICVSTLIANMGGGMRIKNRIVETIVMGVLLNAGTLTNGLTCIGLVKSGIGIETIVALDVSLLGLSLAAGAILAVATRKHT